MTSSNAIQRVTRPSSLGAAVQGSNGQLQLSRQDVGVTITSLHALNAMLKVPDFHADMLKAGLPALLASMLQSDACAAEPRLFDEVMKCFVNMSWTAPGREQVLQQLSPATVQPVIDAALAWLEDPSSHHSTLTVAAGTGHTPLPAWCAS